MKDMAQPRRKCKLANTSVKDKTDLRKYEQIIVETINQTVAGKNPVVFEGYFSTDPLTQSEAVAIGRALAKLPELYHLGKTITTFRLFDGKTYESEESNTPINGKANSPPKNKPKQGGRVR